MAELLPSIVYLLCFATSAGCAALLLRGYGRSGTRLLLWSGLSFLFMAANNLVLVIDLVVLPAVDLRVMRQLFMLAAVVILLFGCVWDLEEE